MPTPESTLAELERLYAEGTAEPFGHDLEGSDGGYITEGSPLNPDAKVIAEFNRVYDAAFYLEVHRAFPDLLADSRALAALRELTDRAVVALHMMFHAGLNKPGFDDCREGLCKDWHALGLTIAAPAAQQPDGQKGTVTDAVDL